MKIRVNRLYLLLAAVAVVTLSSCNRGYGCPHSMTTGEEFQNLINSVLMLF